MYLSCRAIQIKWNKPLPEQHLENFPTDLPNSYRMALPQGDCDACHVRFSVALTEHMTFKVLLSPGWSLCVYSCSSLHRGLLPKRALIPSGRGKLNWEPDLPVHCERTMVIKGLSLLLSVGSSLRVLCPVGKRRCFCTEQLLLSLLVVLLFQTGAGQCSKEFHELFPTNTQWLEALSEESAWSWFGPYLSCCGLSLTKKLGVFSIHEGR